MSAVEQTLIENPIDFAPAVRPRRSPLNRGLKLLCSVRFGVTLLVLLGLACLIGMLVMQQNVEGFANYFYSLTPSQRLVYGYLGFFDIYHSWYFNALLCVLSINIILASVDRFPKTWRYRSHTAFTVPVRWLLGQSPHSVINVSGDVKTVAQEVETAMKRAGLQPTRTEKNGRLYIFAETGLWNRFGAYAVHVGLLTIFLGGFLTSQLGTTGNLPLSPGEHSNLIIDNAVELDQVSQVTKMLPFEVAFTDIQQKLIKKDGPITTGNTIDWITRFNITDEYGTHEASVQMNRPFDFRGYRFFQASFVSIGRARTITVRIKEGGSEPVQEVVIPRNGHVTLDNGTKIRFAEFRGNFRIGKEDPNEDTTSFPNPGAVLQVTPPNSPPVTAYAFGPQMAQLPVAKKPVAGYTYELVDFEKVSDQHILSVQRDPGANVVYIGFLLLFLSLVGVFCFSHRRYWAVMERDDNNVKIIMGGHTNRNKNAFEEKFNRLANEVAKETEVK